MNPIVREWIEKAEGDFTTAERELNARPNPNFDAACYHAQQCAEKLMKALLIAKGVTPPRSHHLVILDGLLRKAEAGWEFPLSDLRVRSLAAVQFRYPGASATREDAERVVETGREVRKKLRGLLQQIEL